MTQDYRLSVPREKTLERLCKKTFISLKRKKSVRAGWTNGFKRIRQNAFFAVSKERSTGNYCVERPLPHHW